MTGTGALGRKGTRGLGLVLALAAAVAAALALSGHAMAETGVQCPPTGMETVATDQPDYPPGSTVHIVGSGYSLGCDVQVQVHRPDGVTESFLASTDVAGNFALDYQLPGHPGVIGEYEITVHGLSGASLASTFFTDAAGAIEVAPAHYPAPSPSTTPRSFTVLARVTSAPTNGAKCVRLQLPSGFAIVSGSQSFEVGAGSGWTLALNSIAGTPRELLLTTSSSGVTGLPATGTGNWARFDFNATTPAGHTSPPWDLTLADNAACSSNANITQAGVRIANATNLTYTADFRDAGGNVVSPSAAPGGSAQTFRLRISNNSGSSGDKIIYAGLALPKCFANPTAVSVATTNGGRPDFSFELRDRFIRLFGGELEKDQNPDEFVEVTFTSSATASCATGNHSFWTSAWKSSQTSATATDNFNITGAHAAVNVAAANTAPTVAFTTAPATSNEGQTQTYSFTITDPDAGQTFSFVAGFPTCGAAGSLVAGSQSINSVVKTGTFQCSFPDGPASSTVQVRVQDSAATPAQSNTASQAVTVSNVAPTVVLSGATSVNEGTTHTYAYTVTDPGQDTFAVAAGYPTCGTGGSVVGTPTVSAAGGSFQCSFPDGPATTNVAIKVSDSDGASDTASESVVIVQVANVPPVVTLTGAGSANEGQTTTYAYTVSDPGTETFTRDAHSCGANGTLSNDSFNPTTGSGSFDCTFPDGPATTTVSITISDGDTSDSDTTTVTIANVPPTATLSAANALSVDEGSTHTYSFSISDPGADTFSFQLGFPTCGAGGTLVSGSAQITGATGSFQCTFPDGPASTAVQVKVGDDDGGASNTASQAVTVSNVAPTVVLSGATSVNEGTTHTYAYTVTDPGQDTFAVAAGYPTCGTGGSVVGTPTVSAAGGSFQCSFPDGPATTNVAIKVSDSDGASDTASESVVIVQVANVPPVVTLTGAGSANEGQTTTYAYTVSDPGTETFTRDAHSCGANGTLSNDSFNPTTGSGSFDCTFPDGPATTTVSITISDGDTSDSDTITVTIANVAPDVTLIGDGTANEGQTKTYTYTVTDPGQDTQAITESCGANGTLVNTLAANSFDCTFPDGPATTTVQVTADDGDPSNNTGSDSITVTVSNVDPTLATLTAGSYVVALGTSVTVTGAYTDPGTADTFTCVIGWDDGGPAQNVARPAGTTSCQASKSLPAAGVYSVSMKVADDDGGESSTLAIIIAVYDPNGGGFVTGGGWIMSPQGSYAADPTASGTANFGFNAKYKKGASVPDGQTEFQLHFASFNFHSESYEWLVVNGHKAQYKGVGKLDGVGGYGFLLTAYDGNVNGGGGVDRFRIKIWKLSDNSVVYDTKMGTPDDMDNANPLAISGGSIVIHKGK